MVKLIRIQAGQYRVEGTSLLVEQDSTENECGCPHCMDDRPWDCPGNGTRVSKAWHIWDETTGDYAYGTGPLHFDRMKDARGWLEAR